MIEKYFERFYRQVMVEEPSELAAPWDGSNIVVRDGDEVMGLFRPDNTANVRSSGAERVATRGTFACYSSEVLKNGQVLRRKSDGLFVKLKGDAKYAPTFARNQIMAFEAVVSMRQTEVG